MTVIMLIVVVILAVIVMAVGSVKDEYGETLFNRHPLIIMCLLLVAISVPPFLFAAIS